MGWGQIFLLLREGVDQEVSRIQTDIPESSQDTCPKHIRHPLQHPLASGTIPSGAEVPSPGWSGGGAHLKGTEPTWTPPCTIRLSLPIHHHQLGTWCHLPSRVVIATDHREVSAHTWHWPYPFVLNPASHQSDSRQHTLGQDATHDHVRSISPTKNPWVHTDCMGMLGHKDIPSRLGKVTVSLNFIHTKSKDKRIISNERKQNWENKKR